MGSYVAEQQAAYASALVSVCTREQHWHDTVPSPYTVYTSNSARTCTKQYTYRLLPYRYRHKGNTINAQLRIRPEPTLRRGTGTASNSIGATTRGASGKEQ